MRQIINSTIMMILLNSTACPNIGDWNVPWQKVIPYATAAAGICFGAWVHKNALRMAESAKEKKAGEAAVTKLLTRLKEQGVEFKFKDENSTLSLIKTQAVTIDFEKKDVDFYCKAIENQIRIFRDRSESKPIMSVTTYKPIAKPDTPFETIGLIKPELFNMLVKDQKSPDQWYVFDESSPANFQFNDHQQARKALDLLSRA